MNRAVGLLFGSLALFVVVGIFAVVPLRVPYMIVFFIAGILALHGGSAICNLRKPGRSRRAEAVQQWFWISVAFVVVLIVLAAVFEGERRGLLTILAALQGGITIFVFGWFNR